MNEPASQSLETRGLRIAVRANNARRQVILERLVASAGHTIVDAVDAQALLIEGESQRTHVPSVVLGRSDSHHAGQLPQDASAAQIDAALRAVALGLVVRNARTQSGEFEELTDRVATDLLTPRELDILASISEGMSNKAMARKLGISLHTVKFHVESLFRKLGARTRAEAVARGLEKRKAETVEI